LAAELRRGRALGGDPFGRLPQRGGLSRQWGHTGTLADRPAGLGTPAGEQRLYALIHAGEIPAHILPGARGNTRILVRPQAVETWLRNQERPPTPDEARQAGASALELLTVHEAALRYPIGLKRLYALIHARQIAHIAQPGPRGREKFFLRPQAIEAWLLAQERTQGGSS
jgi:hypothetical protein